MKAHLTVIPLTAVAFPTAAQLSVESFGLNASYSVSAFAGSASGEINIGPEPNGYLEIVPEATLTDETGTLSATFNAAFIGEVLPDGFSVAGTLFSEDQPIPFYEQSSVVSAAVIFELAQPTQIRVQGRLLHDPVTVPGDIALLNGTSFALSDAGVLPVIYFEASAGPISGETAAAFNTTVALPAGMHRIDVESFSSGVGSPISSGLRSVNSEWDIAITVVPAPGGLALLPAGLVLVARRRC
ncbi:MAG: hypothetical protein AAGH71_01360 [Planctomycetota bacterium]